MDLDALLTREPAHPSELALDEWMAGVLSVERAAEIDAHCAGCDQCAGYVAEMRQGLEGVTRIDPDTLFEQIWSESQAPAPPTPEPAPTLWDRVRGWFTLPNLAVAGVAVAAIVFFALRPADPTPEGTPFDPGVRMKGDLALELARKTAQGVQPMVSGDTFDPDDSVRFVATTPADGRVRVVGIEADGTVFTAWPLPEHAASDRLPKGKAQGLPGAVQLDGKSGKEVLYLVWCPEDTAPSCSAEKGGLSCPKGCRTTDFIVKKAR